MPQVTAHESERRVERRRLGHLGRAEVVGRVIKFFVRQSDDGRALADEGRVVVLAHKFESRSRARDVEYAAQGGDVRERHDEQPVQHDRERQQPRQERPARHAVNPESVEKLCHK